MQKTQEKRTAQHKYDVEGMTCSACSAAVERALEKVDGVEKVNVNLLGNNVQVEFDPDLIADADIIDVVKKAGYQAKIAGAEKQESKTRENPMEEQLKNMKVRVIVSFIFMIPLMYVSMGHMLNWPLPSGLTGLENSANFALTQLLLTLPVLYINRQYYIVGFRTLFRGSPNMDSLIAIGSGAATIYGIFAMFRINSGLAMGDMALVQRYSHDLYFESAAMILALITLGKFLETRSKSKTSDAISKLMDLTPQRAMVVRDGIEVEVAIEEVVVGDILAVRPGESIPVDGVITQGSTAIDQSALTGESIPVDRTVGDSVAAATINRTGYFQFRAEKVGDDTTLAKIIELVEEAGASKAPIAQLADKVSGVFVPVVIGIAILATIIWLLAGASIEFALSIGIAVLVISCPCALGLATPVAIMVGTGKGAQNGILIKSAESLETAHNIQTVVLDKTGTITEGKPKVTDIYPAQGIQEKDFLRLAATIEQPSEHPLALAILERADKENLELTPVVEFEAISGRGLIAQLDGVTYYGGNLALMKENGVALDDFQRQAENYAEQGKTALYFAKEQDMLGVIAVADTVKPTSLEAIQQWKAMGIDVVMLTGDNERTARAIQQQLGIDQVVAEVLPQDKEREVRRLQEEHGHIVAMIGDGINDAPALVRADVGIAIGAGTDIAIDSADIVLMKSDLMDAVTAIQLSKATIRNIKQNLFWAFIYNIIGIPIAAGILYPFFGITLSPMIAAAAMSLSSVSVVTNALRLRFFEPKHKKIKE